MCMYEEKRGWKCSLSNLHLHCINSRRRSTPAWHAALCGLHLCGEGFIPLKDNEPNTTRSFVELLEYQKKLKSHGASNHTRLSGFAPACPFQLKCTMPLQQKLGRALSILQNSRIYVHVLKIKLFTQIYKLISFFNEKSCIECKANAK